MSTVPAPTPASESSPMAPKAHSISTSLFPRDIGLDSIMDKSYEGRVTDVMEHGLSKGTRGNYTSAINAFIRFCDQHQIREDLRFPADERVLCAFVASLFGNVAGTTAETAVTALKRWHETHKLEWNGSERLQLIICGVKNNAPATSKRSKRVDITPKMLEDLNNALDQEDPKDAAVLACANSAFWGQARLGEFVGTSRLKHNPSTHPSRDSIIILFDNNAREIQLPKTKTNQANGESIFLTRQSDPLDPVKALENHFRVNNGLDKSDHLFAFRSVKSHTGRHSLTHEDFMNRVNEIWMALGYQRVTGHSFRIGGTTTLLRNGVPPDVVKELGRWSSDAFHEYWRDIPSIAAKHVEFLHIGDRGNTSGGDQACSSRPSAGGRSGRNQRQGRPARRPY